MKSCVYTYRSLTNDGDKAKQYFTLVLADEYEPSILIKKLILSKSIIDNMKMIKRFGEYYLYQQEFGIKYSTVIKIISQFHHIINTYLNYEK